MTKLRTAAEAWCSYAAVPCDLGDSCFHELCDAHSPATSMAKRDRELLAALLAECPGCHGKGRTVAEFAFRGREFDEYEPCLCCSWVRAFAAREGIEMGEGGTR